MRSKSQFPRPACCRVLVALLLGLAAVHCALPLPGQQIAASPPPAPEVSHPLTAEHERILARAGEILQQAALSEAEQQVRLQVIKATLTGTAIRPADDYPEMRNPKHWIFADGSFVVSPDSTPVDAIADLWVVHDGDGVPVPRIRCLKYTSLELIQGYIQYFRETNNPAGLAALNRLIGNRKIPQELPNGGENLLWKKRAGGDHLLPGDQVWFDNPFFDRGRELIHQRIYEEATHDGKSPAEAAAAADATTESMAAGEEGSNVFYLGDGRFIRGASSLIRLCRDSFQPSAPDNAAAHELVFTQMIHSLERFQEHMIDDNYTAQACLRADPATVHPADFKIERVRSPLDPENLLKLYAGPAPDRPLEELLEAMASHNQPPRLVTTGTATVPLFADDYDWSEQQRVRTALEAVMRTKSDNSWWQLRAKIGDGRYVLTASRGGAVTNFTVGALCGDLADSRLCLSFTGHLPLVPGKLPATFRPEQEFWQHEAQWARECKPLYAMQAALCESAIKQWESVEGTLAGSDGRSHVYTPDEKDRYVAALKKEIAMRNQTRQAAVEEVIVPWLPAPSGWDGFDAERAKEARETVDRKLSDVTNSPVHRSSRPE